MTLEEFTRSFWERVDSSGGPDACWPWTGGHLKSGYGVVNCRSILSHPTSTHRVAFWLTYGHWPAPVGRHTCDFYGCCNPGHIIEGTQKQNIHDAIARGRFKIGGRTRGTWSKGDTLHTRKKEK